MEWQVIDMKKKEVGKADLPEMIFGLADQEHLFHSVVVKQLADRRAGTHKVKTRSEVSGGGIKPYRQKGTGRARRGTIRDPLLRGGGSIFGPVPRDYSQKLNKKVMRTALAQALSYLAREKKLYVVEQFDLAKPSTKTMVDFLKKLSLTKGLVVDQDNEILEKSVRNLPRFKFLPPRGLNVYDLLKYDTCVITRRGLDLLKERFAR